MLREKKLSELISKVVLGYYSKSDIVELVHFCSSLAEAYLRTQRYHYRLYTTNSYPENISDLALDVIAPLFARDELNRYNELEIYFRPLLSEISNEENLALIYLRRLVVSKAKQELITIFKYEDPSGWRIYRNLQLAPKRNQRIGVFKDFDKLYYYYKPAATNNSVPSGLRPNLEEIPTEELELRFLKSLKKSNKTPEVVERVLRSLIKEGEYRLFVSRGNFFHALRNVWGVSFISMTDKQFSIEQSLNGVAQFPSDQNGLMEKLSDYFQEIVLKKYVEKKKATSREGVVYANILESYFNDLLTCGSPLKIPQYMKYRTDYDLLKDHWNLHLNRLEYMTKLGKQRLRELWDQRNFRI